MIEINHKYCPHCRFNQDNNPRLICHQCGQLIAKYIVSEHNQEQLWQPPKDRVQVIENDDTEKGNITLCEVYAALKWKPELRIVDNRQQAIDFIRKQAKKEGFELNSNTVDRTIRLVLNTKKWLDVDQNLDDHQEFYKKLARM